MANNENTVQIQVEVLRAQLDKLIADINSLKNQKISVIAVTPLSDWV